MGILAVTPRRRAPRRYGGSGGASIPRTAPPARPDRCRQGPSVPKVSTARPRCTGLWCQSEWYHRQRCTWSARCTTLRSARWRSTRLGWGCSAAASSAAGTSPTGDYDCRRTPGHQSLCGTMGPHLIHLASLTDKLETSTGRACRKMGLGARGGGYHLCGWSQAVSRPCCGADIGALFCTGSMSEKWSASRGADKILIGGPSRLIRVHSNWESCSLVRSDLCPVILDDFLVRHFPVPTYPATY